MSARGVTPGGIVRSEWIKLGTLRSTVITFGAAVALMVGVGVLASLLTVDDWARMSPQERAYPELGNRVMAGHLFAQLAIAVVGVIAITGEYATGMIRATLAAVPRRTPVLWAKLGVYAAVTLVLMTSAAFASLWAGTAILAEHWDFRLSDPGRLRAVAMTGVTLAAVCVLGTALGFVLRNTAAAIATMFGILMVLPIVGEFSPEAAQYLPSGAISSLTTPMIVEHMLGQWPAFALLCAYVGLAIAGAAVALQRRDA